MSDKIYFRNPQILTVEGKLIRLDNTLSNLFMLIASKGSPIKLTTIKGGHTMETLKQYVEVLESKGLIQGASENKEAVEDWLRSNLVTMVFRGNIVKENISSLRPMHLMSYRIQNVKHNRDYSSSDQIYMMLRQNQSVLDGLYNYLKAGWDNEKGSIVDSSELDVDTTGILLLTKDIKENKRQNTEINTTKPLLKDQTALFNDDIRRLLIYKDVLPKNVFIEYLRVLIGFHLSLYTMKVIYLLPKMRAAGTIDVEDDWSMVVDMTDNLDSAISSYACKDVEKLINTLRLYFTTTFEINVIQKYKQLDIEGSLNYLKNQLDKSDSYFKAWYDIIRDKKDDEDKKAFDERMQYFEEDNYFDRYISALEQDSGGSDYQYPYYITMLDSITMKNSESMLWADGRRSKKHPRRGAIGSKLLEILVQLLVLTPEENGTYKTRLLSIDELAKLIRERYGLIINGLDEERFSNSDVETHAAFQENMSAFKNKLRQIGFYTDLSDSCLLQKIRPRYKF